MNIYILIPVFIDKKTKVNISDLTRCVNSIGDSIDRFFIKRGKDHHKFKIVIIDDHSDNDVKLDSSPHDSKTKIVKNNNSKGQGSALNYAINNSQADMYAITDSDCVADNSWVENFIEHFETSPKSLGVVGPNWYHQRKKSWFRKKLTQYETELMRFIFTSYIDKKNHTTKRIDCRNLILTKDFFSRISGNNFFTKGGAPTSSHTSYLRKSILSGGIVDYNPKIKVYHKGIDDLSTQIIKYFKRGYYGNYREIYDLNRNFFLRFVSTYFSRHFLRPIKNSSCFWGYIFIVHISFWLGIFFSDNKNIDV